ncbi:MAG: hypothetical protein IT578_09915 [Verrucomicrobiae bacterium]|nr:hypothetical protein [Verrucomicrobiae bacterium]
MNKITLWIIEKIVRRAEPVLTGAAGRCVRRAIDYINGALVAGTATGLHWLPALHLPLISDKLAGELEQYAVNVVLALISYGLSSAATKLAHAQGLAGTAQLDTACPKTRQLMATLSLAFAFLLAVPGAMAQTPVASGVVPVAPVAVTDTNQVTRVGNVTGSAAVEALEKLDVTSNAAISNRVSIIAGVVYEGKTAGAITGGRYSFNKDWMAEVDVLKDTGDNTVAALEAIAGYRIPIHNVEFDALAGAGYSWNRARPFGYFGAEIFYAVNEIFGPFTRAGIYVDDKQPVGEIDLGFRVLIPEK